MEKQQFLENLLIKVRDLDIGNIMGRYIRLTKRGNSYLGLCPFHNDKNLGSFVVTPYKNIFKCFSCDQGGDGIKFVALYNGINYIEATFKIGLDEGLITAEEYEEYFQKRRFTKDEIKRIEKTSIEDKPKIILNEKERIERDEIFNLFLDLIKLKDEHREYLNKERNLSDEIIEKRKYKSYPTASYMDKLIEKMKEKGIKDIDKRLEKMPGFYQKKVKDNWVWTFPSNKGILMPIKDAKGYITGLQIRRDKKDEDRGRYIWFSSSFADYTKRYKKGTSSGSPLDVLYPDKKKNINTTLFITEGRFKSEAIVAKFNSISISVQGVSSWNEIDKEIEKIEEKLNFKFTHIYIAFDSDMLYKHQVYEQLKKMSDMLEKNIDFENRGNKKKSTKGIYYIYWDEPKGIDDFLFLHYNENVGNLNDFKKFNKSIWDENYKRCVDKILKDQDVSHLRDIEANRREEIMKAEIKPFEW